MPPDNILIDKPYYYTLNCMICSVIDYRGTGHHAAPTGLPQSQWAHCTSAVSSCVPMDTAARPPGRRADGFREPQAL